MESNPVLYVIAGEFLNFLQNIFLATKRLNSNLLFYLRLLQTGLICIFIRVNPWLKLLIVYLAAAPP